MNKIVKIYISFFLLLVFSVPLLVKVEHHHYDEHQAHHACCSVDQTHTDEDVQFQPRTEECPICEYEFSLFQHYKKEIISTSASILAEYINNYSSCDLLEHTQSSVSLRAPPIAVL